MKEKIAVILTLVIIIILIILIATGFKKRTDVVLTDYSVSEDGTKLTLKVAVSSPMGYTRNFNIKQGGDNQYITFYSTFGGFNSKIGAKDTFEIELNPSCTEIYFYKGDGGYNLVLEKDKTTNKWKQLEKYNEEDEELIGFTDIPKNFEVEDAIERGYFVIDGREGENKIYNKDVLDNFIENTNINSKNRKPDKIRIANYNYDGYPTIYEVEYKVMNKEQKETNETGYILTIDASRNNTIPKSIVVNDDIPGEFYGITVDEDAGINAAIIKLSLYAIIDYVEEVEQYKDIEITRYLLDDKIEVKSANQFNLVFYQKTAIEPKQKETIVSKNEIEGIDYNVYAFEGHIAINLNSDSSELTESSISLREALLQNKITMEEIIAKANQDEKDGKIKAEIYKDGGSMEYHYENYTIIKCHTLDENRDVYIGTKDLKLTDVK